MVLIEVNRIYSSQCGLLSYLLTQTECKITGVLAQQIVFPCPEAHKRRIWYWRNLLYCSNDCRGQHVEHQSTKPSATPPVPIQSSTFKSKVCQEPQTFDVSFAEVQTRQWGLRPSVLFPAKIPLPLPRGADGTAPSRAANVRTQARFGALGSETLSLWVVGKGFNDGICFPFHRQKLCVPLSCSVYVDHFSSACTVGITVALGEVQGEWSGPALIFPHPSRAGTIYGEQLDGDAGSWKRKFGACGVRRCV